MKPACPLEGPSENTMIGQPSLSTSYEDVHEDMRLPMLDDDEKRNPSDAPSPPPPDGIRVSAQTAAQHQVANCSCCFC